MSKDNKKYSCIKGCFPVNNKTSKLSKSVSSKENKNTVKLDGRSVQGLPLMDQERLNHTRRWVQNVSTQANYDPEATLMEDSRFSEDSCLKLYNDDANKDNSIISNRHKRKAKSRSQLDANSLSSSCVSLATEVVTLNLDDCRSLGITIVGHTNGPQGDCGIFVGCVKKGGVAEICGRIEPGDLILEVNEIDLEKMSNDKALAILKGEVAKGGLIRLTLAKYWDMEDLKGNESQFYGGFEPLYEPAGSIKPPLPPPNPESSLCVPFHNTSHSFINIPSQQPNFLPEMRRPFLGSELVDWIQENIAGMRARNEARSYAQSMLNNGFISSISPRFHEDGWYAVVAPVSALPSPNACSF